MWWLGWSCSAAPPPPVEVVEPLPVPPVAVEEPVPPSAPRIEPLPESGPFVRELLPGLVLAAHLPPEVPDPGYSRPPPSEVATTDRRIFVLTADPARFEVVYLSSRMDDRPSRSADVWAAENGLVAAWNPGMFEPDGKATGYTRSGEFLGQEAFRRQHMYASYFVVGPGGARMLHQVAPKGSGRYATRAEMPAPFLAELDAHELVSQSLGILKGGKGVYPARTQQWSELAYGVDDQGRIAVVFSRYPYEMRELGDRLAALGVGLTDLLHGEGGPEASFVVTVDGLELGLMGSYETGFFSDRNQHLWGIPAVMGLRPR